MPRHDEEPCPRCGAPVVAITIQVGAGPRTLVSCDRCDRRWWRAEDRVTDLDGVIDELGDPAPSRRRARR